MARVKKYIFTPATAAEIRKAVGVTRSDSAIVARVLKRLGYDSEPSASAADSPTAGARSKSAQARKKAPPSAKKDAAPGKSPARG